MGHRDRWNVGVLRQVDERRATHQGERLGIYAIFVFLMYSQSANYIRSELPIRIAHRLRDMQALPYVVVTQEGVARVYEASVHDHDSRVGSDTRHGNHSCTPSRLTSMPRASHL